MQRFAQVKTLMKLQLQFRPIVLAQCRTAMLCKGKSFACFGRWARQFKMKFQAKKASAVIGW